MIFLWHNSILMALVKPRRRFILVQSTSNANVTEDNMEPYHVSVFQRSTSMPPLPKLRNTRRQSTSNEVQPVVQVQEDVSNKKKSRKFNFETMRRKSARIGIRISNVFGLSAHTVDEQFNFEEHRFRAIEKFLHLFLRQTNHAIEIFRVNSIEIMKIELLFSSRKSSSLKFKLLEIFKNC